MAGAPCDYKEATHAPMIKSELVRRIARQNPHLHQSDVENILNAILGEVVSAMARGDRVDLRGFGAFSIKVRPARTGRNPRTGTIVPVQEKAFPVFRTSKPARAAQQEPMTPKVALLPRPARTGTARGPVWENKCKTRCLFAPMNSCSQRMSTMRASKVSASTYVFSVPFVLTCRSGNRQVSFHV